MKLLGLFWVSFVRTWVTSVLPARVYQSLHLCIRGMTFDNVCQHISNQPLSLISAWCQSLPSKCVFLGQNAFFPRNKTHPLSVLSPTARARKRVLFTNRFKGNLQIDLRGSPTVELVIQNTGRLRRVCCVYTHTHTHTHTHTQRERVGVSTLEAQTTVGTNDS